MSGPRKVFISVRSVWLLLIVLTSLSYVIFDNALSSHYVTLIIVLIAMVKAQFIVIYFMEVGKDQLTWRRLYMGWVAFVPLLIFVMNYFSKA